MTWSLFFNIRPKTTDFLQHDSSILNRRTSVFSGFQFTVDPVFCRINASRREEGELEKLLQPRHMLEWKQNTQNTSRFTFNEFNCLLDPWSIWIECYKLFILSFSIIKNYTSNRKIFFFIFMRIFLPQIYTTKIIWFLLPNTKLLPDFGFMISIDFLENLQKISIDCDFLFKSDHKDKIKQNAQFVPFLLPS